MYFMLTALIAAWNIASGSSKTVLEEDGQLLAQLQEPNSTCSSHIGTPISTTPSTSTSASTPHSIATTPPTSIKTHLPSLYTLTSTNSAYLTPHASLPLYTTSHLYLTTLLPAPLLPLHTVSLSHNLCTRSAHNAFALRPPSSSDGTDSGEFLGFALYPSASFFNHSCAPNLAKKRVGRAYEFTTTRDVKVGEELCITYLGGDEVGLGVQERRERLKEEWGFVCGCGMCVLEGGEGEEGG